MAVEAGADRVVEWTAADVSRHRQRERQVSSALRRYSSSLNARLAQTIERLHDDSEQTVTGPSSSAALASQVESDQ